MYTTDLANRLSVMAGMAISNWPSRKPLEMVCLALMLSIRLLRFIVFSLAVRTTGWKVRIRRVSLNLFTKHGCEKACREDGLRQYHM